MLNFWSINSLMPSLATFGSITISYNFKIKIFFNENMLIVSMKLISVAAIEHLQLIYLLSLQKKF